MALSNESEISSKNFFDNVAIFGGLYTKSINHFFIETVNSKKLVSDTFVSRLLSVFTISSFLRETFFPPSLLCLSRGNGEKWYFSISGNE